RAIAVHVVDVEPYRIERELVLAVRRDELADLDVARVAPARLVMTERPQRRARRAADEGGESLDDVAQGGSVDEIDVELAPRRLDAARLRGEIEVGAGWIVDKESPHAVRTAADDERARDI